MSDRPPNSTPYPLLDRVSKPEDLRQLAAGELPQLAEELRSFLIDSVAETGGHFAAGLGTVELTVALHYIYNTPFDRLVWDTGHQSYPHKILTGRRERMPSLRQHGGLSGFPKRDESDYDTFGVGHSSTSISAAVGMAIAAQHEQQNRKVVAIIGDGALTAGMAFEALNHAGDLDTNLLVILNDNEMSISPNVGGMSNHLARILSGKLYASAREGSKKLLGRVPPVWELARRAEEHVKGMVVPGTLFEELGFNYIGPINGHDLDVLTRTLKNMRQMKGPQFLHVVTKKGKGFELAEKNPTSYHGVSPFDRNTGKSTAASSSIKKKSFTDVFSDWVCDMAQQDQQLMAITPAMCSGSGLDEFSERFPDRYFDVGIAEQHSVTMAAGMACDGLKPIVAIYSSFLQRAYDQLVHDVALQNLPVLFAIDRAGLVGADGATHTGNLDISFLRCVPNMTIMTPADENECRQMLYTGFQHNGPACVRYPRGSGAGVEIQEAMQAIPIGTAEIRRQGKDIAILSFGTLLDTALAVAEELDATVVNMRFVKPLDEALIVKLAAQNHTLVTIEENVVAGGAGSGVNEALASHRLTPHILNIGLPDHFVEHGTQAELLQQYGLDRDGIHKQITEFMTYIGCQSNKAKVKSVI
ncbi:MAG: 1-deoxy-D-xylulose-5-phosphate synthase [Gammaproteobacteria bacterium]|nr:1-deoxy-D-xylulose-5-phosphate synthase [Gammaproteobacteria bacterium]PCH62118.1 MAG: 1-deoxy-D-xylulose-5-phosphate synthase [Gammaproteobacteria bacterium]PCH62652.1 MAG: 1-deoxy-D-xylulose-5-phosphate synthase [Gammaproteobacteria bacterium]